MLWGRVFLGLVLGGPLPAARAATPLDELLADPALRGARVSVLVGREDGSELFSRDPERPMVPASSMKVVTSAAALARWGPAFRFETPVLASGPLDAKGVLQGDLWIVGQGDPSLVSEELWRLAEELRLRGLREVRGGLGVDDSYFDAVRWHPDWPERSRRAYQAPVSAFAANYSSFRVVVGAGAAPGQPLRLEVAPAIPYFRLEPGGRTLPRRPAPRLALEPRPDGEGEVVRLGGSMPPDETQRTYWRSVAYPAAYAAALLRWQLMTHGIRVHGGLRTGRPPENARELLRFQGESLGRIVWKLNKFSNNFIAEQLTKALGADRFGPPGTWSKGIRALRDHVESVGGLGPGETLADGSGLSPHNRLSARTLLRLLLDAARRFESGPEFMASLPLGGLDGTLEERLTHDAPPVRAKTGHLDGVSALCGLLPSSSNGDRLGFVVLINGTRSGAEAVDTAVDRFVVRVSEQPGSVQGAVGE